MARIKVHVRPKRPLTGHMYLVHTEDSQKSCGLIFKTGKTDQVVPTNRTSKYHGGTLRLLLECIDADRCERTLLATFREWFALVPGKKEWFDVRDTTGYQRMYREILRVCAESQGMAAPNIQYNNPVALVDDATIGHQSIIREARLIDGALAPRRASARTILETMFELDETAELDCKVVQRIFSTSDKADIKALGIWLKEQPIPHFGHRRTRLRDENGKVRHGAVYRGLRIRALPQPLDLMVA